MSSFEGMRSALMRDDMSNEITQPELKEQDIPSTEEPVSNNEVKLSSSGQKDRKTPFICTTCSKYLSSKSVLTRHMKYHLEKKPFSCDVCQKTFVQKYDLQRHFNVHSKMPILHKCDQCTQVFSRKRDLFKHMVIHKPSKQHNCQLCNEVFKRKSDLMYHMGTLHSIARKRCIHKN